MNILVLFGYFFAIELFLIVIFVITAIIFLIVQKKAHKYNLSNFQTLLENGDVKMTYKDSGKPVEIRDLANAAKNVKNNEKVEETEKEKKWKNPYTGEEI